MFSRVVSAVICGVEARKVVVEADVRDGMPVMTMVGYLSSEVREAQDRVRAAVRNSGFTLPVKRITVNLAPADLRKEGSAFDLAIAVAVLAGFGIIPLESLEGVLFLGELSLNGLLEPVRGTMEVVSRAEHFGCHTCIVPEKNLPEGSAAGGVSVLGASNLMQVVDYLTGDEELAEMSINIEEIRHRQEQSSQADFADIHGQTMVRRACEVAVSGMHNIHLADRSAGSRQDHGSQVSAIHSAQTDAGGDAGDFKDPRHSRNTAAWGRADDGTALSLTPSFHHHCSPGRGRSEPCPGRGVTGSSWCVVSGRAAGVLPDDTGGSKAATAGRHHSDFPQWRQLLLPSQVYAGGEYESLQMWLLPGSESLPLHRI